MRNFAQHGVIMRNCASIFGDSSLVALIKQPYFGRKCEQCVEKLKKKT